MPLDSSLTERVDWLAERRSYLGGSDAAAVMGVSPWRTPLDLYREKTDPLAVAVEMDPHRARVLMRGQRLEPYVLDLLREETGLEVAHRNRRFTDPEHPFLACEVDAEATSGENIEIKTALYGRAEWGDPGSDEVPIHYAAQAMHGLMVTRREWCVFGVLIGVDDFRVYRVRRDDETIAGLRAREVAFWQDHVLAGVPPPVSTAGDALRYLTPDDDKVLDATHDGELLRLVNTVRELRARADEVDGQKRLAEDALKVRLADATRVRLGDRDIATWKAHTSRRFDLDAFRAASAANATLSEQFRHTVTTRSLRVR